MKRFLLPLILLAGCGPIPLPQAEKECFERARLAQQPRGEVFVGATSDGPRAGFDVTISSDFISGRDPSEVYNSCVMNKAGQPPSRALYDMPGWKG